MEWRDEGIILGTRRHGETSAIVEVMTREHGRHMGMVRGGRSRRMQPLLQPGNHVDVTWWARLDEHMGSFTIEPLEFAAARLIETPVALYGIQRQPRTCVFCRNAIRIAASMRHCGLSSNILTIRWPLANWYCALK